MTSHVRNYKIVNLRAIAILTVVVGHSIILYSSEWNTLQTSVECPFFDSLKHIINLYQMPLYFFISGFLMYGTLQKNISFNHFFKDKVNRLIIPYFFVGLLWMIPIRTLLHISDFRFNQLFSQITHLVLGIGNGHLGFLYSLFTMFLFFFLVSRAVSGLYQYVGNRSSNRVRLFYSYLSGGGGLIFMCGLAILANYIKTDYFNIIETFLYIIWFYIGLFIRTCSTKTLLSLLIVFALLIFKVLPNVVYGLAIILVLYYLVPNKENKIMSFFDKYSYGIYLFHSPLIYIAFTYAPNIDPWLMFVINFLLMGGVALLISYIVKSRNLIGI